MSNGKRRSVGVKLLHIYNSENNEEYIFQIKKEIPSFNPVFLESMPTGRGGYQRTSASPGREYWAWIANNFEGRKMEQSYIPTNTRKNIMFAALSATIIYIYTGKVCPRGLYKLYKNFMKH